MCTVQLYGVLSLFITKERSQEDQRRVFVPEFILWLQMKHPSSMMLVAADVEDSVSDASFLFSLSCVDCFFRSVQVSLSCNMVTPFHQRLPRITTMLRSALCSMKLLHWARTHPSSVTRWRRAFSTDVPATQDDETAARSALESIFGVKSRQHCLNSAKERVEGIAPVEAAAKTIEGVTIDIRSKATATLCSTFDEWVSMMPVNTLVRRPVVVGNVGCRGSGKTVSLLLCMQAFISHVDHKYGGKETHAIYITFNSDQLLLHEENVVRPRTMLALRVLHRAVAALSRRPSDWSEFVPKVIAHPLLWTCTLGVAVRVARTLLGMPPTAHLLLAADELRACAEGEPHIRDPKGPCVQALKELSLLLDNSLKLPRGNGVNYCVVSAYGAIDPVQAYTTGSKREFRMMDLPPIWAADADFISRGGNELPEALTNLLKRPLRAPRSPQDAALIMALYESGGHPRRVQALLHHLKSYKQLKDLPEVTTVYAAAMNLEHSYSEAVTGFAVAVRGNFGRDALQLLSSLFFPITVPTSSELRELLAPELCAQFSGLCQLMPRGANAALFMPHPALTEFLLYMRLSPSAPYGPERALLDAVGSLSKALWSAVPGPRTATAGKPLERVTFLLMFCTLLAYKHKRHTPLTLGQLLRKCGAHAAYSREVGAAPPVVLDVDCFPGIAHPTRVVASAVTVRDLQRQCVFHPKEQYNPAADVFAVLRPLDAAEKHILVCFQCAEWTKDTVQEEITGRTLHVLDKWRRRLEYFEKDKVTITTRQGKQREIPNDAYSKLLNTPEFRSAFDVVHVLVTVNPVAWEGHRELGDAQGVMDLESIAEWCPTVAYNAIAAYKAQQLHS
jgi:hypothetical protein